MSESGNHFHRYHVAVHKMGPSGPVGPPGPPGPPGSQTPWTSDIDAASKQLVNVLRIGAGLAAPAYAVDAAGDMNVTGVYRINGVPISFSPGGATWPSDQDANNHKLTNVNAIAFGGAAAAGLEVTGNSRLDIGTASTDNVAFWTNGVERMVIGGASGAARLTVAAAASPQDPSLAPPHTTQGLRVESSAGSNGISLDVVNLSTVGPYGINRVALVAYGSYAPNAALANTCGLASGSNAMTFAVNDSEVMRLDTGTAKLWIGGSLKTLSVDGNGFVKAA